MPRQARQGKETVVYASEALKAALGRTLGVPVFQEQITQVSMIAAGFTPGEADGLRRAMAAWKRWGGLDRYYSKLVDGMISRGYSRGSGQNQSFPHSRSGRDLPDIGPLPMLSSPSHR